MKRLIFTALVAGSLISAQAQWLPPEAAGGALAGGVVGGIIGSSVGGHHTGEGIALGLTGGLLLGSIAASANGDNYGYGGGYAYPAYGYGYGYYGYHRRYRYYAPFYASTYYSTPTTYYSAASAPAMTLQPSSTSYTTEYRPATTMTSSGANSLFGR